MKKINLSLIMFLVFCLSIGFSSQVIAQTLSFTGAKKYVQNYLRKGESLKYSDELKPLYKYLSTDLYDTLNSIPYDSFTEASPPYRFAMMTAGVRKRISCSIDKIDQLGKNRYEVNYTVKERLHRGTGTLHFVAIVILDSGSPAIDAVYVLMNEQRISVVETIREKIW